MILIDFFFQSKTNATSAHAKTEDFVTKDLALVLVDTQEKFAKVEKEIPRCAIFFHVKIELKTVIRSLTI